MTTLAQPALNAAIIDKGVLRADIAATRDIAVTMIIVAVANLVVSLAASRIAAHLSAASSRDLRSRVRQSTARLGDAAISRWGIPTLLTRSTTDVSAVGGFLYVLLSVVVIAPLMAIGAVVLLVMQGWALATVTALASTALLAAVTMIVARLLPLSGLFQHTMDRLSRTVREQISGRQVIRTFARQPHESARFTAVSADLAQVATRLGRLQVTLLPTVTVIANLAAVVVAVLGAALVDSGRIQLGQIAATTGYLMQILVSVSMVSIVAGVAPRAASSAGRVTAVLDAAASAATPAGIARMPTVNAARQVSVPPTIKFDAHPPSQPDIAVRADLSLVCPAGKVTALLGPTGSGKTSLLSRLAGLTQATTGVVSWDNDDVTSLDSREIRSRIGFVAQGPTLISGTVAENLRIGRADADDAELWAALEFACAADFVAARPEGLHTHVAQEGSNFSGGQRQRLAIARAILRRPALYVLDDPCSALDSVTELAVFRGLRAASPTSTIIMASQRISSIRIADHLVVLDRGHIVASGDHATLEAFSPAYRAFAHGQVVAGV